MILKKTTSLGPKNSIIFTEEEMCKLGLKLGDYIKVTVSRPDEPGAAGKITK